MKSKHVSPHVICLSLEVDRRRSCIVKASKDTAQKPGKINNEEVGTSDRSKTVSMTMTVESPTVPMSRSWEYCIVGSVGAAKSF